MLLLRRLLLLATALRCGSQSAFRQPGQPISFTHIPKTGGTSLRTDVRLAVGVDIGHLEWCFEAPAGFQDGAFNFVFLRSPRAHVLSQFLECKYDAWGREVTSHLPQFPFPGGDDAAGFAQWVAHFYNATFVAPDGRLAHDFNCYSPHSFQTRQLGSACVRPHHVARRFPAHLKLLDGRGAGPGQATLGVALSRLPRYAFVGVTDLYPLSWCLLLHRLRERLPDWCFADSGGAAPNLTHAVHSVPRHKPSDFDDRTWASVDALSPDDQALFAAGLQRLLGDWTAFQAEPPEGRRLASSLLPRLRLLSSLAYMPQLRAMLATGHSGGEAERAAAAA